MLGADKLSDKHVAVQTPGSSSSVQAMEGHARGPESSMAEDKIPSRQA